MTSVPAVDSPALEIDATIARHASEESAWA